MTSLTNVVVAGGTAESAVARVEMLSPAGFAGLAVSSGLDVQNYVTDRQPDLVLIEGAFDDVDVFDVVRRLKQSSETQHIPIIMLNASATREHHREGIECGLDDMIDAGTVDEIVLARLKPFVRLSTMHAECLRRVATAAEFRIPIAMDGVNEVDTTNCRVLVIGEDYPSVAKATRALEKTEFEIFTERSPIAAGTRLLEETFDAAVIAVDESENIDQAYFLCAHIRNNGRLFNLPVLVAVGDKNQLVGDTPYRQGASIALPLSGDIEDMATALRFLVRRQRLRWNLHGPLTATLQKNASDSLDGLYGEAFLRAHLARTLEPNRRRRRNVSLAVFSLQNVPGISEQFGQAAGTRLMQAVANRISGMVRIEDTAARLDRIEICALFPDTEEADAKQAADRITGALQHATFDIGDDQQTEIWMQTGIASAVQNDAAESLIARARDNLN